jgi:signal transduction histidine kinase/CheY-like chemotaxis protein/type II secretory pathway predicted ATPase ExeA
LDEPQVLDLGRQLVGALAEVHRSGLVHRDVKPKNIVFDATTGKVRLVDFGFAASIDAAFRILEPVGTLEYAAPEQVSDLRQRVDGRADLYAVGCVLYECVAGVPPFADLDPRRLLHQHQGANVPDVRDVAPHVSRALAAIIKRLLARSPDDRYPDAGALLHDLHHIQDIQAGRMIVPPLIGSDLPAMVLPLLGRDDELNWLREEWNAAQRRDSRVIVVRGGTGSGKTRLSRALIDEVIAKGGNTLLAACHAWDPRPFSAIREIVEGYAKINRDLSHDERSRANAALRALAGDLAPLLKVLSPSLAALFADAAPVPQSSDAQHIFVEGLAEFLAKVIRTSSPVVLFIDDVQWLDSSSRRVLRRALDRLTDAHALSILAVRGEPGASPEVDRFLDGLSREEVILRRLDEKQTIRLVQAYLGVAELDAELVKSVVQLSDGSPLSTLEVLRMMLDEGLLQPSWGTWKFDRDAVAQMQLPQNTIGVLRHRIESLDDMTKTTLSAAAVIGMTFPDRLLHLVCNLEEGHTVAALAEARRAMLVEPNRHGTHRFVHDSIREVLIKRLTDLEQRECHQAAAEAMDRLGGFVDGETLGDQASSVQMIRISSPRVGEGHVQPSSQRIDSDAYYRLASHYARGIPGRTPRRAYDSNVEAGLLAFHTFDNERALLFFAWAAEAGKFLQEPMSPGLAFTIGEAKLRTGALDESLVQFERVLAASQNPVQQASALARMAWIYEMQLDTSGAWTSLEQAFAKLGHRPADDSVWRTVKSAMRWAWQRIAPGARVAKGVERDRVDTLCVLWYQTGRLATIDGKPMRVLQAAFTGLGPAVRLGPSKSLANMYLTMSFVFIALGRKVAGRRYLALAENVARETGDPVALAHSLQVHSAVASWEGDLQDALDVGSRCLDEYGHWRELSEYCLLAYNQQFLEALRGRSLEAWRWMERVIDRVNQHEGQAILLELVELGARAALTTLGREAEADTRLTRLSKLTVRTPANSGFYVSTFGPRVRLFTERADLGRDFESLVEEFDKAKFNPRRVHPSAAEYYIQVAHARIHAVLRAPAEERLARIHRLGRALGNLKAAGRIPITKAHATVVEAYHAVFLGRNDEAEQLFTTAEMAGRRECAPWILYSVHRGRAHLLLGLGLKEAARDQARMAEAIAEEHGMAYRRQWVQEEFGLRRAPRLEASHARHGPPRSFSASELRIRNTGSSGGSLRSLMRLTHTTGDELEPHVQAQLFLDEIVYCIRGDLGHLFLKDEGPSVTTHRAPVLKAFTSRASGNRVGSEPSEACRNVVDQAFTDWSTELSEGRTSSYLMTRGGTRTIVAAPFSVGESPMGVVYVDRDIARGDFSESDGELLAALASQVPLGLELARALNLRRRAEDELQRVQRLESMGRFAESVAREFGSVLEDIRLSTEVLSSTSVNGSRDKIQAIQDAAKRAADLTERLLAFSQGHLQNAELINVNDRIHRAAPLLRELLGHTVVLAVRPSSDIQYVMADVGQIDHLVVTLAARSRDVMLQGGTVVIETSNAMLQESDIKGHPGAKAGHYVRISVSDTGPALEPKVLKEIFEPFVEVEDVHQGLALGTLYRNVVRNGGFIDVESIVGEGTTFRIYWPAATGKSARNFGSAEPPKLPGGTETILIVEHEAGIGEALGRALKSLGYRVLRANDAVEALKLVARRFLEIDLVISDAVLPGMNGFELGRELVKMRKTLRVLYLSDPAERLAANGGSAEKIDVLQKPVQQDALAKRVREVLDRRATS